jgi:hypothetical protein
MAALHHTIGKIEKPLLDGIPHHDPYRPHQTSSHFFPSSHFYFILSSKSTILL